MPGDVGDYWREAKRDRKAAARRIGVTYCTCGAKNLNIVATCHYCGQPNDGYRGKRDNVEKPHGR